MRHHVFGKKLGRTSSQRQSLLRGASRSFFLHAGIKTTNAKAIFLRPTLEKLIKTAQKADLSAHRELFRLLQDRRLVNAIIKSVTDSVADKTSNYTKIVKHKIRAGDQALVVKLLPTFDLKPVSPLPAKKEKIKNIKGKKTPKNKSKLQSQLKSNPPSSPVPISTPAKSLSTKGRIKAKAAIVKKQPAKG